MCSNAENTFRDLAALQGLDSRSYPKAFFEMLKTKLRKIFPWLTHSSLPPFLVHCSTERSALLSTTNVVVSLTHRHTTPLFLVHCATGRSASPQPMRSQGLCESSSKIISNNWQPAIICCQQVFRWPGWSFQFSLQPLSLYFFLNVFSGI